MSLRYNARTFDLGHALVAVKLLSKPCRNLARKSGSFGSSIGESSRFRLGFVFLLELQDGCVFQLQLWASGNQVLHASRNNTLSIDARLDRRKNFQQQFSFTDAEVTLNPGLETFMSATEDSDRFLLTGTGTSP